MAIRIRLRRQLSLGVLALTIGTVSGSPQFVLGQAEAQRTQTQNPAQQKAQVVEQTANDGQSPNTLDERADDETPDLGLLTASCPANAVCVKQVLQNSPADEAGIEAGDYLLSIDGKQVTTPGGLNKLIATLARDKEVKLKVWRQGKEIECKAYLASKADQPPKCHDAWLGVMLSDQKNGGVRIEHIVSGSPASKSELEEGDVLAKVGKVEIKDAKTFLEKIEEMGPGDAIQLTIRRHGQVRDLEVMLGSFCDAPMAFVRHLHSHQQDGEHDTNASTDLIDRALDDMRNLIRELRDEVRELKGAQPAKAAQPAAKKGEVSMQSAANDHKYVSQIQVQIPQRNYRQQNYNRGYNSYRNNNYYGQYGQRYSPYFGNGYQTPYGRNNYYYRYNSQPYYYGGINNWYGNRPRSGIQVGPNVGVYWY